MKCVAEDPLAIRRNTTRVHQRDASEIETRRDEDLTQILDAPCFGPTEGDSTAMGEKEVVRERARGRNANDDLAVVAHAGGDRVRVTTQWADGLQSGCTRPSKSA